MVALASGCKINLFLEVLGRREDGYHDLETVMQPLPLSDRIQVGFSDGEGIGFSCDDPRLPRGGDNLAVRAARLFQELSGRSEGLSIRLEKRIPLEAGLGGGSGNAAASLLACNRLHGFPLSPDQLAEGAVRLGMDVPFFLEPGPALATGRGERIRRLAPFGLLEGAGVVLVHPGFGVPTPWAYSQLALPRNAAAPGRARSFLDALDGGDWEGALKRMRNDLEVPVFRKYPLLRIIGEELVRAGADGALMSGSGSTVFGLVRRGADRAEQVRRDFLGRYGKGCWSRAIGLSPAEEGGVSGGSGSPPRPG